VKGNRPVAEAEVAAPSIDDRNKNGSEQENQDSEHWERAVDGLKH